MIIFKNNMILEGEQAEAYKKRKAEEKENDIGKEVKTAVHRNNRDIGFKTKRYDTVTGERTNKDFLAGYKKEDEDKMKKDKQNRDKAAKMFNREIKRRGDDNTGKIRKIETDEDGDMTDRSYWDFTKAADASMRHVRRHPKQYKESNIFKNIEMI